MSAKIDPEQVRHIAHLARLKLSDEEVATFGDQLASILHYVEKLKGVDTAQVEPTAHSVPVSDVFRDDVPGESMGAERVLANAPGAAPPYFKVPKVLDQDSA
ncbi:MAG: Asp-tRNA(Asn)/Glu-tRNA(Gln) amidotransferase subunit GatC [Phycisphaerae bacterium]